MSSTEPMSTDASTAKLQTFFRERLTPAAEKLRAAGVELFPTSPDDATSWYDEPNTHPTVGELSVKAFEARLRELLGSHPELAELVDDLMALAHELEQTEDTTDEVSPFVYVMF